MADPTNKNTFNNNVNENYGGNVGYTHNDNRQQTFNVYPQSPESEPKRLDPPQNLPYSGVSKFVGRSTELETLHKQLQDRERVVISAVSGMGGIGKTELALQYAQYHLQQGTYPGGICWLRVPQQEDVGTQILQFARAELGLKIPTEQAQQRMLSDFNVGGNLTIGNINQNIGQAESWDLLTKIRFCWRNWLAGDALVIFDDVTEYEKIEPYLPPNEARFKVVITTRKKLGPPIVRLDLDVLKPRAAMALLKSLVGRERLKQEPWVARKLCKWLGYLPLGLELVGRYLAKKKDISLADMQQRLEQKRLEQRSLEKPSATMTAQRGVAAAFELSWLELDKEAQQLSCLLSLFALAPIPWFLVENCLPNQDSEDLEDIRDYGLLELNLIERKDEGIYQLHQLIREFLRDKMEFYDGADELKRGFCRAMAVVATLIPQTPTQQEIAAFALAFIPHLAEAATVLPDWLSDEDLYKPFQGLGWFYQRQGAYDQALPWFEQCLALTRNRLGCEHPLVATSLNNLAELYFNQGCYELAEPLLVEALEMSKKLLGTENPSVVASLNNLASLYKNQGRYSEAESLYVEALEMCKKLLACPARSLTSVIFDSA